MTTTGLSDNPHTGSRVSIAAAIGWFIYKLIMRIVDGMETKLDVVDEEVAEQIVL